MGFIKRKHRPEYATVQREWAMWGKQMEKTLPGYGEQNETLHWMVRILTGVRVLYCLFYLSTLRIQHLFQIFQCCWMDRNCSSSLQPNILPGLPENLIRQLSCSRN